MSATRTAPRQREARLTHRPEGCRAHFTALLRRADRLYGAPPSLSKALASAGLAPCPVVLDVDCGYVPPHLALVTGAPAQLTFTNSTKTLTQTLCSRAIRRFKGLSR